MYPGVTGGTNWWPPSFSPDTRLVYVPVLERPNLYFKEDTPWAEGELFLGGATQQVANLPWYKAVRALDALDGSLKWEYRLPRDDKGDMGGLLSTAGGLDLDGSQRVLVSSELDAVRFDDLWNTDVRWAKTFGAATRNVRLVVDLFNVFNSNTELVRVRNAGAENFAALSQNLSPRILRFGVRIDF